MNNGNRLRDQLAEQLYGEASQQPFTTHNLEEPTYMADNPLYLATNVDGGPNYSSVGEENFSPGGYSGEMHININVEPEYPEASSSSLRLSCDHPSATSNPATYAEASTSFPGGFFHSEISEVPSMPTNSGRRHSDSQSHDYYTPPQGAHLHVIGTPPHEYHKLDEPPYNIRDFLRISNFLI